MPLIRVELTTGRTIEQRRAFAAAVTKSAAAFLGAKHEKVRVIFREISKQDIARGGVFIADDNDGERV